MTNTNEANLATEEAATEEVEVTTKPLDDSNANAEDDTNLSGNSATEEESDSAEDENSNLEEDAETNLAEDGAEENEGVDLAEDAVINLEGEEEEDTDLEEDEDLDPEDDEPADTEEPIRFEDLGLSDDAMTAVEKLGYETPTPVQAQGIPVVLEGRDLIAAASTGTGKTAAFLLPLLSNLPRAGRGKRPPRVLVVTPTRELAQQIAFTCIKIARATGHFATTVYGGTPYAPQIREIKGGTDILIATPGRLCDLMERKVVDLSHVEALVLDEADRMLDMGFLPDVTTIVEALPEKRQTLLFSATIDQSIEKNLGSLLHDPVMVEIAHRGETAATVDQYIMPVPYKEKQALLEAVLREKGHERVIVFARTKTRTEECKQALIDAGFTAESIHSDKPQGKRRRALEDFRKGKTDILVATDVLSRGIDVTGVDHVINFDLPDMPEDYVHRIGRTGRAGETGYAISFVSANSRKLLREIEELIGRDIPVMSMETYKLDRSIIEKGKKKRKKGNAHSDARAKAYKGELDWQREEAKRQREERRERETLERLGIIEKKEPGRKGGSFDKYIKRDEERHGGSGSRDDRRHDDRKGGFDGERRSGRKDGFGGDRRDGRKGSFNGERRDGHKGDFGGKRDDKRGYGEKRGDRSGRPSGDRRSGFGGKRPERGGYKGHDDKRGFRSFDKRDGDRRDEHRSDDRHGSYDKRDGKRSFGDRQDRSGYKGGNGKGFGKSFGKRDDKRASSGTRKGGFSEKRGGYKGRDDKRGFGERDDRRSDDRRSSFGKKPGRYSDDKRGYKGRDDRKGGKGGKFGGASGAERRIAEAGRKKAQKGSGADKGKGSRNAGAPANPKGIRAFGERKLREKSEKKYHRIDE